MEIKEESEVHHETASRCRQESNIIQIDTNPNFITNPNADYPALYVKNESTWKTTKISDIHTNKASEGIHVNPLHYSNESSSPTNNKNVQVKAEIVTLSPDEGLSINVNNEDGESNIECGYEIDLDDCLKLEIEEHNLEQFNRNMNSGNKDSRHDSGMSDEENKEQLHPITTCIKEKPGTVSSKDKGKKLDYEESPKDNAKIFKILKNILSKQEGKYLKCATCGNESFEVESQQCSNCNNLLRHQSDISQLITFVIQGNQKHFNCSLCEYSSIHKTSALRHVQSKHSFEKPIKCSLCSYTCKQKSHLTVHISWKHTLQKPFKCKICPYRTAQKSNLMTHAMVHSGLRRFHCDLCDYAVKWKSSLIQHMKTKHDIHNNKETFQCYLCDYNAAFKRLLRGHIVSQHIPRYKCEECNFRSGTKSHMNRHRMTHLKVKPFSCSYCSYNTSEKKQLLGHMRSKHSKGKRFQCYSCDFATDIESELKQHITLEHNRKGLYTCASCGYQHGTRKQFVRHLLIHRSKKPRSCEWCSFSCVRNGDLMNHVKAKHTKEKPFHCAMCDYRCVMKRLLPKHIQSKHSVKNLIE